MRNLKTLTTQDHMIHIIESEPNDDIVCGTNMQLDEIMTIFYTKGSINLFTRETISDEWELRGNTSSPLWAFTKPGDWFRGAVATESTIFIIFIPKNKEHSVPRPGYLSSVSVENTDRESFIELGAHNYRNQVDVNTYEDLGTNTLDDEIPDDVIVE
jgi:hypothetical protein